MYRLTWNQVIGLFYYPLTPAYYKYRSRALRPLVEKVYVSELQAEPWERNPIPETPLVEQKILMNEEKLERGVNFAKRAGFDEMYLWGVEWWYWLKQRGDPGMWDAVKNLVEENK